MAAERSRIGHPLMVLRLDRLLTAFGLHRYEVRDNCSASLRLKRLRRVLG